MNPRSSKPQSPAEYMTEAERKKGRSAAVLSTCFGGIPTVMLADSAIVIVFATMLGLSDMFSMMTTSFAGISYLLLLIPGAYISDRFGLKKSIYFSSWLATSLMLMLAFAPFAGEYSKYVVIGCSLGYCLTLPVYLSAWFPLLDTILCPSDRGPYFGMMRASWQFVALAYIMLSGVVIGANPPIWLLQVIIGLSALLSYGRIHYVRRIPDSPVPPPIHKLNIRIALATSMSNSRLCGFSVYLFCLYLASYATVPLTFIYLKNYLKVTPNIVVMISSLAMLGTMAGYYLAGKLIVRLGTRKLLLIVHPLFAVVNFVLFFCNSGSTPVVCLITSMLVVYGVLMSIVSVVVTAEMMSLARPGNKTMAMALCGTFYYAGMGISRMLTSFVLGVGILADTWSLGGMSISRCQTLYFLFGAAILLTLFLLVIVPAINPRRLDYYEPAR